MKAGSVRRLGAAAALVLCALVIVVSAAADADQKFTVEAINSPVPEDGTATFKISLSDGVDDSASVTWSTIVGGSAVANQDYVPQSPAQVTVPKGSWVNVSVPIVNDGTDEGDEEFSVQLSDPSGASLGTPSTASATITDNDDPPSVSIAHASAAEDAGMMPFAVTLSPASGKTVKVTYATEDDSPVSAEVGSDYTAKTEELIFKPGEISKNATVAIANDTTDENNETFKVRLSAPVEASLGSALATGTINDNDGPPTVNIENANAVSEGGVANFTVRLMAPSVNVVRVDFTTENGTAVAPGDYTAKAGFVQWNPGETSPQTVTVQTVDDTGAAARDEPNETFRILISNPQNAKIGSAVGNGTINDNDDPPTARIANAPDVTEGGTAKFTVTLDGPSGRDVRVSYRTADGNAVAGSDYEGKAPGSVRTIPAGETTADIEVKTTDDTASEGDETFQVLLGDPNETVKIGSPNAATAVIKDNDALRTVSITGAEVTEGDDGTVNLDFKVKLSGTTSQRVEVTAVTQDGSAVSSSDYQFKSVPIVWAPNTPAAELEKTFRVLVNGDILDEPQETFTVKLESPQNATIVTAQATGTIKDNDNRSGLSISDASVNEPSSGGATLTFTVKLSPVSARAVRVNWTTANGTASAGSDYTASAGALDFAPGETSKDVSVAVTGDTVNEENETLMVNLSGETGAGIADAQGIGTIVDKNAPPSLSIDDLLTREGETATFTITLSGNTLRTVTVVAKTIEGSAKEGTDFHARRSVLTFAPGETSKTFLVPGIDDAVSEPIETYSVGLEDATNATVTKSRGTATIDASDQAKVTNQPLPPTPPAEKPKPTIFPKLQLGPRLVTVDAGVARMLVTCAKNSPLTCSGSVSLERVAKPKLVFGTAKFTVKRGGKAYVRIALKVPALKLLARLRTMPAKAVVVVKTSAKNLTVTPGVITLKQGTPAPKPKVEPTQVVVDP